MGNVQSHRTETLDIREFNVTIGCFVFFFILKLEVVFFHIFSPVILMLK